MELIRKIVIGQNPKDAMAYFVGQRAGGATVDSIVLDDNLFDKEKGITLWKTIDDMPCLIEHDCDFE